jgi:HK97 family phage portal protein
MSDQEMLKKKRNILSTEMSYQRLAKMLSEMESKSFDIVNDFEKAGGVWNQEEKAFLDMMTLKGLFTSEHWVFVVVDLIGMKISNQPLKVYRKLIVDGEEKVEPAPNHPLQKTINEPNPSMSYADMMYNHVVDLTLIGNAILWKGQLSSSLWPIPAESVMLKFDKDQTLIGYDRYSFSGYLEPLQLIKSFNVQEVIHTKKPNPSNYYWGLSPFIPGRRPILFNRFTGEYLNNYYIKGATPGLSLEMSNEANEKNATRLLRSFEAAYTGRANQRRTLVLPKGVTAKQIAHTLADQQLKDYLIMNKEDILALLKVPKHEVGLQTGGSLGSEEYKTALKNFWASTLIPTQNLIAQGFNRAFKNMLGDMFFCAFDNDNVDILKENEIDRATQAAGLLKTHTINEVRGKIYKLPPLEGGDQLPGFNPLPAQNFTLSSPVEAIKAMEETAPTAQEKQINSADVVIKKKNDWFTAHKEKIGEAIQKPEVELQKAAVKLFADQSVAVIKKLDKIIKKFKKSYTKADDESKNEKFIKELIATEIGAYFNDWITEYKDIGHGVSIAGWILAEDTPEKVPGLSIELDDKTKKELLKDVEARGKNTLIQMNKTTVDQIYNVIKDGIGRSDTVNVIADKISSIFGDPDRMMGRAQTIARTESLGALSIGKARQTKEAAKVIPDLKKLWISTADIRTRGNPGGLYPDSEADHWGLHGQVVDHDADFTDPRSSERLSFPRDPKGSAGAVINCRCTWITLPAKEMNDLIKNEQEAKPNE